MKRYVFAAIGVMVASNACVRSNDERVAVRLNEVGIDPVGVEGTRAEWIELHNAGAVDVDLGGFTLADEALRPVAVLPPHTLPAGGFVMVMLGSGVSEGAYLWTGTPGDFLDDLQGSLSLFDADPASGELLDYVAWSRGAPFAAGAAHERATALGEWPAGTSVDASTSGPWALLEGETLGRDAAATDTDAPGDWTDHGGRDAFRTTPGSANAGGLLPPADAMKYAHVWINELMHDFGYEPRSAWADVVSERVEAFELEQVLDHTFDAVDAFGADVALAGRGTLLWTSAAPGDWDLAFEVALVAAGTTRELRATRHIAWAASGAAAAFALDWTEELVDAGVAGERLERLLTGTVRPDGAGGQRVEYVRTSDPAGTTESYVRTEAPLADDSAWSGTWSVRTERAGESILETNVRFEREYLLSWEAELLAGPKAHGLMNTTYSTYDVDDGFERWVLDGPAWEQTYETGAIEAHLRWIPTVDARRAPFEVDLTGAAVETRVGDRSVFTVVLADGGGVVRSWYVDPLPADGGITKAVITVVGIVGTVVGVADYVLQDRTAPVMSPSAPTSGCDVGSGWSTFEVTVLDPDEIGVSEVDPSSLTATATEADGSSPAVTTHWKFSRSVGVLGLDGRYQHRFWWHKFTVRVSHDHYESHGATVTLFVRDNARNGTFETVAVTLPPRAECVGSGG